MGGYKNDTGWPAGGTDGYFNGSIDEARVSTQVRSAAWIRAQYLSMTDAFVGFGAAQGIGVLSQRHRSQWRCAHRRAGERARPTRPLSRSTPTAASPIPRPPTSAVPTRFTYRANDGTDNSNVATVTITVNPVNDAPAGTNTPVTINEDTTYNFTVANFGFTDVDAGDTLSAVRIDTLPAAGTLILFGSGPVVAGQLILAADITAGNLRFTPAVDANGAPYTTFTFSVRDTGGPAFDPSPNTMTVNVTAVNDAPVIGNLDADALAYSEGAGAVVIEQVGVAATVSDVDSANFDTGTLTVSFTAGSDSAEDVLAIRNQGVGRRPDRGRGGERHLRRASSSAPSPAARAGSTW